MNRHIFEEKMKKIILLSGLLLLSFCSFGKKKGLIREKNFKKKLTTEVSLTGRIFLKKVRIGNSYKQYRFQLQNRRFSVISREMAKDLNLEVSEKSLFEKYCSNYLNHVVLDIVIDNIHFDQMNIGVTSEEVIHNKYGNDVDAIIGLEFIEKCLWQFERDEVIITDNIDRICTGGKYMSLKTDYNKGIPFFCANEKLPSYGVVDFFYKDLINFFFEEKLYFKRDSSFSIVKLTDVELGWNVKDSVEEEISFVTNVFVIKDISLTFMNPRKYKSLKRKKEKIEIFVIEKDDYWMNRTFFHIDDYCSLPTNYHLIGRDILKHYIITFDLKKRRIYFRPIVPKVESISLRYGVKIKEICGRYRVNMLHRSSTAFHKGLQIGAIVREVNGRKLNIDNPEESNKIIYEELNRREGELELLIELSSGQRKKYTLPNVDKIKR